MTLGGFLSRIKVDQNNPHESIPISYNLQDTIQKINTRSGAHKAGTTVGKVHGHHKPLLPDMKPENAGKILALIPSGTTMTQCHLVTILAIRRGLGRASLRRNFWVYSHYSNQKYFLNYMRQKFQVYKE